MASNIPQGTGKGRPRKPTGLKVLHGDFKQHAGRENKNEPMIIGGVEIAPPATISSQARERWDYLLPILVASKIMTAADVDTLAEYCEAVVVVKLARHRINLYVTDRMEIRPGMSNPFNEYNRAINVMTNLGGRLGLTPADRARLQVTPEDHGDDLIVNG